MKTTVVGVLGLMLAAPGLSSCGDNETPLPTAGDYATSDASAGDPNDPATPSLTCFPNLDGVVEASEIEPVTDNPVSYRVNPPNQTREVDLVGTTGSDGQRIWDWTSDTSLDEEVQIEASTLEEQWFAEFFPEGEFSTPFDLGASTLGVYRHDEEGLWLLGLVSADPDPPEGQTLLVYSPEVLLYSLPLEVGEQWISTGELAQATLLGLPYAGKDVYEVVVEAAGELRLPELTFEQALLVRIRATLQPAVGASVVTQQASFVAECFGEVARATSLANEDEVNFTTAQEVRRLAL